MAGDLQQVSRDRVELDPVTLHATAASTIALIGLGEMAQARAIAAATVQPALIELGADPPFYPMFQRGLSAIGHTLPRP